VWLGVSDSSTYLKFTNIAVNSVLGLLYHVNVGDVADISEVHALSIFSVEVCRLVSFFVYIGIYIYIYKVRGRGKG
jgi:hypothetical protein